MTAKTPAQRKAEERARAKDAGMAEVRGIIAHKDHHEAIKEAARKVAAKLAKANRPTAGKGD